MAVEELDLRAELEAAMKGEPEEPVVEIEVAEEEATRERDERGRFVARGSADAPEPVEPENAPEISDVNAKPADSEEPEQPALSPPNGWSAEAKAKWHELPEEIQAEVQKREADIHKQASKTDEERNFGREMYRTVQPYMAQIQAEGGTPARAVQSLLNTAYMLRVGTPDQKRQLLLQTAQQFGVDLAQPGQQPTNLPPEYQALTQRINQLEGTLTQREQLERQQLQTEVQSELEAFAADPKHPHYPEVKANMAALLREGTAKDLQDAYEQSVWARPDIRATLLATQKAEEEQKRKAEAKRKAEEAKRKGASITGGPGNTSSLPAPEDRSLREELRANMAASTGAV